MFKVVNNDKQLDKYYFGLGVQMMNVVFFEKRLKVTEEEVKRLKQCCSDRLAELEEASLLPKSQAV